MVNDRENYCRLIGLNPNKESTYSADSINSKITAKAKKWEKESKDKQNDLDRRFKMNGYLEQVDAIRKTMSDPVLKAKEFEDGRKLLKTKASKLLKSSVTLHDESQVLVAGAADALAKKLGWDGVTKDDLIKASGIKNTAVQPPVNPKVANAYHGIRDIGAYTPMEVLNRLIENRDLDISINTVGDGCSMTELRNAFEVCEKRVSNVKQDVLPTQDSYIQALRSIKTVLDDDANLTSFIKYGRCMRALSPALETMDEDYGQPFSRDYIDNILNIYLKGTNLDNKMAVAILEDYCVRKKYLANFSTRDSKLTICPNCGGLTECGGDAMCCSICGFSIRTRCPNCNTEQSSGNRTCIKCGFDFQASLNKARKIEERFKKNLANGMLPKANDDLNELKKIYATYPNIIDLTQDLRAANVRYNSVTKNIEQSYKMRKFRSCQLYCDSALTEFPYIIENDVEIRKKYEDSMQRMRDADEFCKKAESAANDEERMNLYVKAAERCPDHPATKAKMMEYPPESPADATLQVRDGEGKIVLRFAIPENRAGTTFCVYRARDRLPVVTEDTVPLTEIPNSVYVDKTMDPGVDYYYSVYSKRYGILSKEAAVCGPAAIYPDVDNVTIEPIAGGLRINYEKPKGCVAVRIWRKEGTTAAGVGEEIEIAHDGKVPLDDYGLKGGVKYNYLFVAEYQNKNRTERSMGNAFSCTTIKFPDPVRDMVIRWNKEDGTFTASWKSKENVVLYSSPKKVTMYGRMIPIQDLNSWMEEIQPLETYEDGMRFSLKDGAVQYIYPMIPAGKVAVRGKDVMIANLRPFRDVEGKMSGGDCDITMDWPVDAESAVIAIKDNATVTDPNDITAEKITVSREAYDRDRMIRIPMGNSKKKVMTLFAQYTINGERMYSRGMSIDIFSGNYSKVKYTMELDRSMRGSSKANVSLETEPGIRMLPPMCAISVSEGIPLKIWDGENIWTCRTPIALSNGRATISFTAPPKLDLSKVRLFFLDEEDYHSFRFIHPLYNMEG